MKSSIFWTWVMIILMVFSVFGAIVGSMATKESLKYNETKFTQTEIGYTTKIAGKTYLFNYYPANLEDIEIDEGVIDILKNTKFVWFTYNPNQSIVADIATTEVSLMQVLDRDFGIFSNYGMTTDNKYNISKITCDNATFTQPVIEFRETQNITKIRLEDGKCVIIESDYGYNLDRAKDRLLYSLLGVMK